MTKILNKLLSLLPYFILIAMTLFISFYVYKTFDNNFKTYNSIYTGIISGIITAIMLFVAEIIWRKNIVTWIENLLYQDVYVEGEWSGIIVPFVGLETIDKIQKEMAWKAFRQTLRREVKEENNQEIQEAEIVTNSDESTGQNQEVKAEIVIHDPKKIRILRKREKRKKIQLELNLQSLPNQF